MTYTRRDFVRTMGTVGMTGLAASVAAQDDGDDFETIRVPQAQPTIQAGVDAASEGDLVFVEEGTYGEMVTIRTPGITVRGIDRNEVVVDGEFNRNHGIIIDADGVAIENMTVRHVTGNAFYWRGVVGFRGSYLTAYNNGYYGIYAYGSRDGRFEHSYASGHPDAGFYLGRNDPYEAVVSDVTAEYNVLGYSGTSTGGDLTIEDSTWRHNMVGIMPNTLDTSDPPQRSSHIVGNDVYANNYRDAPNIELRYPFFGMGILVWGGNDNLIEDNDVRDHEHFGIVAEQNVVEPSGNVVRGNAIHESGTADIALSEPAGRGNQFANNEFETSQPVSIETDATDGSSRVAKVFADLATLAESGDFPAGDWQDQPTPDNQPTHPAPEAPPRPANKTIAWD